MCTREKYAVMKPMNNMVPTASCVDLKDVVLSEKKEKKVRHDKTVCVDQNYNKAHKVTVEHVGMASHRKRWERPWRQESWELKKEQDVLHAVLRSEASG